MKNGISKGITIFVSFYEGRLVVAFLVVVVVFLLLLGFTVSPIANIFCLKTSNSKSGLHMLMLANEVYN